MSELDFQGAINHVQQMTAAAEPRPPRLVPATSEGGVWDRLQTVIDTHGEFGDLSIEKDVVRKASFAYPRQIGLLNIQEVPNPNDLDGDLAYRVLRVDHRGEAEAFVTRDGKLGKQAVDAIHWDLDLYANADQAELLRRRAASSASWLIEPLLLLNTIRPSVKRHRAFDQSKQYDEKPVLSKEARIELHKQENAQLDSAGPARIPLSNGSLRREKVPNKSFKSTLLRMGASHAEVRYVFEPARRRK